jgi:L-alanine-DL-glutamate epimerase-like enolase superfamily enzyme
MTPLPFRILDIQLYERPVKLRLPFKFGVVTLTDCPQAFVRVRIRTGAGREAEGAAAELLAPKWFDKNLSLSNDDNFNQLRQSLHLARQAYLSDSAARSAFGHFSVHYGDQLDIACAQGLNPLIACYGPALLDRALLDALCRAHDVSFYQAIQRNLVGINDALTPDLAGYDLNGFLASLAPSPYIALRHTVGLADAITAADLTVRVNDGLPETLDEAINFYGCSYFKLKMSGTPDQDIARLTAIARTLDRLPNYVVTLDGNEQFDDAETAAAFWQEVRSTSALKRLADATLYIEQPLPRAITLDADIRKLAGSTLVLIDEADNTLDAFVEAIGRGYTGVSSKSCKGIYKSLLNAARCRQFNEVNGARYFMTAEDLTSQAGLAVQQDLALVNLLGLTHVERNGHHYVNGFRGQAAGPIEQEAFLLAQPALYENSRDSVRLKVSNGLINLSSLASPGFATSAYPDWQGLRRLD